MDRLSDWLNFCLIDLTIDWLIIWSIDVLFGWLIYAYSGVFMQYFSKIGQGEDSYSESFHWKKGGGVVFEMGKICGSTRSGSGSQFNYCASLFLRKSIDFYVLQADWFINLLGLKGFFNKMPLRIKPIKLKIIKITLKFNL